MEIDIGIAKSGRQAFGFDDIAIVPSRRTRDPDDIDISWQLDAFKFDLPMMGSAMDSAISPETAVKIGRLGGLAVLNLEGLWTRYEDPAPCFAEIAELSDEKSTRRMQEIYLEPVNPDLIGQRVAEIKAEGVVAAASLTPQRVEGWASRHTRDSGHGLLRRACLQSRRASQPQGVHRRVPGARHRRGSGQLLDLAPPDAHGGGGCPGRSGSRGCLHHPRRPRNRCAAGDGHRRRGGGADSVSRRDRSICARDRRRRNADRGRRGQGDRLWRRRRDDRIAPGIGHRSAR